MVGGLTRYDYRAFASVSTSYNALSGQTRDLHGEILGAVEAGTAVPELGLRYSALEGRLSAQLTVNLESREDNRQVSVAAQTLDSVNPLGLNGRYQSGNTWVGVDRSSRSVEFTLTATPVRTWRLRLVASQLDGRIASDVMYPILYNDQFHTRGGNVTYASGAPLLVDPAGRNGPRTTPLTLAMLNDPADPYFASPDPDSGAIGNSALRAVLTAVDPVNGTAATHSPGQPISSIQYHWSDPNRHGDRIVVFAAGEKTTGMNEHNLNLQSHYAVPGGRLKGLGFLFDVRASRRNRAYYISIPPPGGRAINATRTLHRLPPSTLFGAGLTYTRKIFGRTWQTQLNVSNVFNHAKVLVLPQPTSGAFTLARLSASPRRFTWSNTIGF